MTLTAKDVAEITRLLEESTFTELTLETEGVKLSLRRGPSSTAPSSGGVAPQALAAPVTGAPAAAAAPATAAAPVEPGTEVVRAPLLGTFYRAPKPGAPPYVDVGATVEPDTIIGIIEVMKLMNTVRAGVRGTVVRIMARDGVMVEYDEALIQVRP